MVITSLRRVYERQFIITKGVIIAVFVALVTAPSLVLAAPYGCGAYGADSYQNNCPTASSTTTSNGGSATNNNAATSTDDATAVVDTTPVPSPTPNTSNTTQNKLATIESNKNDGSNLGVVLKVGGIFSFIMLFTISAFMRFAKSKNKGSNI